MLQDRWLFVPNRFAVEAQFDQSSAKEHSIDVAEIGSDLSDAASAGHLVQRLERQFGEVRIGTRRAPLDLDVLGAGRDDVAHIHHDGRELGLAERLGPDAPLRSEPAGCALHSHAELRKPAPVRRDICWSECPLIVVRRDAGSVVAHDDPRCVGVLDVDLDLEDEAVAVQCPQALGVREITLDAVVHELSEGVPRLVVQVLQDSEHLYAGADGDYLRLVLFRPGHWISCFDGGVRRAEQRCAAGAAGRQMIISRLGHDGCFSQSAGNRGRIGGLFAHLFHGIRAKLDDAA